MTSGSEVIENECYTTQSFAFQLSENLSEEGCVSTFKQYHSLLVKKILIKSPKFLDSEFQLSIYLSSVFQIQQLAILKPVEVGKSYIPQKKALMIDTFIYLYSGLRLLCHLAACTALLFQVLLPDPSIIKGLCVVLVCLEELHASQPDRFFNHKQFF